MANIQFKLHSSLATIHCRSLQNYRQKSNIQRRSNHPCSSRKWVFVIPIWSEGRQNIWAIIAWCFCKSRHHGANNHKWCLGRWVAHICLCRGIQVVERVKADLNQVVHSLQPISMATTRTLKDLTALIQTSGLQVVHKHGNMVNTSKSTHRLSMHCSSSKEEPLTDGVELVMIAVQL